ncbi:ATPase [Sphingomonas spermidinifaciens]|uniref:ATPase n=1 Tax=Sphingomonas spermidinifaciens TaxID=1141889 RepID=A0A2A4B905_9SPHN|nr:SRPBCC family protein [Sphingomonas spermidinifaciens]PCD04557.1 ATPase [Sphingomonas spermidinifaciens]
MSEHDLVIERRMAVPRAAVWRAWRDHATEWFCPLPWKAPEVEYDLRPGGRSHVRMVGPEGEDMVLTGVVLEAVEGERVVTTDAFAPGWVPQTPFMIAITEFLVDGDGTLYRATARHWTEEAKAQHEAMGFHEGWGTVAGQLEAVAKRLHEGGGA